MQEDSTAEAGRKVAWVAALARERPFEVVTSTPGWPTTAIAACGRTLSVADVLVPDA